MTASTAMKVTVEHVVDRDITISATFEFFIDTTEDAHDHGLQAADAFTAFLNGYGEAEIPE